MIRLLLLTLCCLAIFLGFVLPFLITGALGLVIGVLLILLGASLLWYCEIKTKSTLKQDTLVNRVLKADGENLVDRK